MRRSSQYTTQKLLIQWNLLRYSTMIESYHRREEVVSFVTDTDKIHSNRCGWWWADAMCVIRAFFSVLIEESAGGQNTSIISISQHHTYVLVVLWKVFVYKIYINKCCRSVFCGRCVKCGAVRASYEWSWWWRFKFLRKGKGAHFILNE